MSLRFTHAKRLDRFAAEQAANRRELTSKVADTKAARHAEQRARARAKDEAASRHGHVAEPFMSILNSISGGA